MCRDYFSSFSRFFAICLVLALLLWLAPQSNAQCPQGNYTGTHVIYINGVPHETNFPVISTAVTLPINAVANTARFAGNVTINTARVAGNVCTAPFTGSFHNFGYVRPAFSYSPYFAHYQSGGTFTYRYRGFNRYR